MIRSMVLSVALIHFFTALLVAQTFKRGSKKFGVLLEKPVPFDLIRKIVAFRGKVTREKAPFKKKAMIP